jgi:hypothetical protein
VQNCANTVLQGVVTISVQASDHCSLIGGHPTITLTNGAANDVATFTNESPAGTFNYTWNVTNATANGTWTVTVAAADLDNVTTTNFTLCVNEAQITGQVQLQNFVGTGTVPPHARTVVFVATTNNPTAGTNVLQTWTLTLTNVSGNTFSYLLMGVPPNANGLSAKTAWNLREKVAVVWTGTQGTANFTGAKLLPGADLTGDNVINLADYLILGNNFYTYNAVADIDGNGQVDYNDYYILYLNYFTQGDPQ